MMKKNKMFSLIFIALFMTFIIGCNQSNEGKSEENEGKSEENEELDEWPTDQVTLVVPYNAGGSADRQARALAPLLQEELDTTVLVENRPGGGGAVGSIAHLKNDPNDGSYIIYQSHPHFDAGALRSGDYEFEDFDYLAITHESPQALFVRSDSNIDNFSELIDKIKSNPNEINYATTSGSWSNVAIKMVLEEFDLEARGVPFDGGAPMRTALLAGEVEFLASDIEGMIAGAGDDARSLGVFADEPYEKDKDVPLVKDIMKEKNIDTDFPVMSSMRSIMVKNEFKEEYPERWKLLVKAIKNSATSDEYIEWGESEGMFMSYGDPDEALKRLKKANETLHEYKDMFE